jgi:hypothetical protein
MNLTILVQNQNRRKRTAANWVQNENATDPSLWDMISGASISHCPKLEPSESWMVRFKGREY